ncbi:MAG: DUF3179 domain-containing protein [Verrucomicrobia bacterium]|nr:DUF3179 domain-containing protein [Verrucomicrobiota bacterium]
MNSAFLRFLFRGLIVAATLVMASSSAVGAQKLGFNLDRATIPVAEIHAGGPPRDGIPSIDRPKFVQIAKARFMRDGDLVVSFTHRGETRAYPLRILVWHEIVNDRIGDLAINVSYCPLCGSAMVFDRTLGGRTLEFGVSGLLYRSDVLMYDRQTESLWSQLEMAAVSGPQVGGKLALLPAQHLTWRAWKKLFPEGKVLSTDTGFDRDYDRTPYADYENSPRLMFPVNSSRRDLPSKAWVAGIVINGVARAYPHENLPDGKEVQDTLGGTSVRLRFDRANRHLVITDADGTPIPFTPAYWFAWQAFHPDTTVWSTAP